MSTNYEVNEVCWSRPALDHLTDMFDGYRATLLIQPACELEIFDKLSAEPDGRTAESVADAQGWHVGNTARLLDALTSLKLVSKHHSSDGTVTYKNTASGALLQTGSEHPQSMKPYFMMFSKVLQKGMTGVAQEVRTGANSGKARWDVSEISELSGDNTQSPKDNTQSAKEDAPQSPKDTTPQPKDVPHSHKDMPEPPSGGDKGNSKFMYNIMEAMQGPYAKNLATLHDFSQYKSVVDVGGGTGILSYTLSRQYPDMKITILEMASVIAISKQHFIPDDFEQLHVEFMEGNCFEVELPVADLYVISKVMHHFSPTEISKFLADVYNKLPIGGALMILEQALNDAKDGPVTPQFMDLFLMSRGIGRNRSFGEYVDCLERNNFRNIQCTRTNKQCEYDVILATKT